MAETVFSCPCGLLLKVYGEDQAGSEVTCPSCQTTVTVPTEGEEKVDLWPAKESVLEAGHSTILAMLYLLIITITTLGLIKYLLFPTLYRAEAVVNATDPARKTPDEPAEEKPTEEVTKNTTKRDRNTVEPDPPALGSDLPEYKAVPIPEGTPVAEPFAPVATAVASETTDSKPTESHPSDRTEAPQETAPPQTAPARNPRGNSPYAHISNDSARKSLEYALMNTRHVKATWTAEIFLKSAEKAADGDVVILNEVRKLRDKIVIMRNRAP